MLSNFSLFEHLLYVCDQFECRRCIKYTPCIHYLLSFEIGVENKLDDNYDLEFEKLLNFNKTEEEKGYAPLNNIKDNYVVIEKKSNN